MAGNYEIDTYSIRRSGTPVPTNFGGLDYQNLGSILCKNSSTGDSLTLLIIPDGAKVPMSVTIAHQSKFGVPYDSGYMGIRRDEMSAFIDILRNEKPVFMRIFSGVVARHNNIYTGYEPVGEGDDETV